jgi:hypothetical protein
MKNIHILPTDKPSRLCKNELGKFYLTELMESKISYFTNQNIYITSDDEIKDGDYGLIGNEVGKIILTEDGYEFLIGKGVSYEYGDFYSLQKVCKKIILTTYADLIKDGVQAIDDEFLEWLVKNPSCETIEVDLLKRGIYDEYKYQIIIPKEEPKQENCCTPSNQIKRYKDCIGCDRKPKQESLVEKMIPLQLKYNLDMMKQETLEEAAEQFEYTNGIYGFKEGVKWQAKRMYSKEDLDVFRKFMIQEQNFSKSCLDVFVEQFKKK